MAINEAVTLNGLALNPLSGNFAVEAIDFTPPKKKPEWAQSSDGDGSDLVRTPLFENRVITATVRITPQASMNAALERMGELVDQLQEAEKNPGGIPLEWTPANSTKTITFYVLTGEVTGVPVVAQGAGEGWFASTPVVTISMTCKPFGYGVETEVAAAKSIETGLSVVVLTVPTVTGDVPAEGRLVIKDTAAVGRRFVEWGLENRYYDAATALILDSEDMTPVGGAQSTALGSPPAYKRAAATKWTIATTLLPEPTICCNTGNLKHVGTYRVKARVQATIGAGGVAEKVKLRLGYQDNEGPIRANAWQTPPLGGKLCEVDLGIINSTPAITGTGKWLGQIEAYSENTAAKDTLHVDYLVFIPVLEGYGKARGLQSSAPGTVAAFDNFTTGTLSGLLNARTPAVGAAWATSGAATDWSVESAKLLRNTKTDAEPRFGVIGAAIGNSSVVATHYLGTGEATMGTLLRWVNATNYAFLQMVKGATAMAVQLGVVVAGATTVLAETSFPLSVKQIEATVTLTATLDGALAASGSATIDGGIHSFALAGSHSSVATAGALASGKAGILNKNGATFNIHGIYSITAYTLAAIPYCVQPSRTMEVRSESAIASDSTGTYYGPVPLYRGSRFYVPQDGSANRTSRVIVKADRNDLQEADQETIADAFTAAVFATPRYHVVPR